jgi:hypothetical protein
MKHATAALAGAVANTPTVQIDDAPANKQTQAGAPLNACEYQTSPGKNVRIVAR